MTEEIRYFEKLRRDIFPEITQRDIDVITLNVNIEPAYTLDATIQSNNNFISMIINVGEEYRNSRNLHPLKIIILGPPASGKSTLAKLLEKYYQISYIEIEDLIKKTIKNLVKLFYLFLLNYYCSIIRKKK